MVQDDSSGVNLTLTRIALLDPVLVCAPNEVPSIAVLAHATARNGMVCAVSQRSSGPSTPWVSFRLKEYLAASTPVGRFKCYLEEIALQRAIVQCSHFFGEVTCRKVNL